MNRFSKLVAIATVLWLGCTLDSGVDPVAGGGDDFPNSKDVRALGKTIASRIGDYASWASTVAVPDSVVHIESSSPQLPDRLPESNQLQKRRAAGIAIDSVIYDTSRIADSGMLLVISLRITDALRSADTLAVQWSPELITGADTSLVIFWGRGKTVYLDSGSIVSYAYEDANGDGIINNPAEERFVASVRQSVRFGEIEAVTRLVIDAGSDRDFDDESDNLILASEALVTSGGVDTASWYRITDADGDAIVVDPLRDSNLVDIDARVIDWTTLIQARSWSRFVVFSDSTLNYPVKYRANEKSLITPWQRRFLIRGMRPDSSFFAHDTVVAEMATIPALGDSTELDSLCMTVRLGGIPQDSVDDSLIGVDAYTRRRLGRDRTVAFSFVSQSPVAHGDEPSAGEMSYQVWYRDDTWAKIEGEFSEARISAAYNTSEGDSGTIAWDRQGNPAE